MHKTRKPLFPQLETIKPLKKLKIEEKIFEIFFEVSGKSHSAEKCKRCDPLEFSEHPFVAKYQKIEKLETNWTLWRH